MMKRSFLHILIYPVLLLFLFSTAGFTMFRHECRMSGETSFSFFAEVDTCCKGASAKKKSNAGSKKGFKKKKKSCCTHSSFAKQLKVESNSYKKVAFESPVSLLPLSSPLTIFEYVISNGGFLSYTDSSPPIPGRDILVLHSVFRI